MIYIKYKNEFQDFLQNNKNISKDIIFDSINIKEHNEYKKNNPK